MYKGVVIDYYNNRTNVGKLDKTDKSVGTGLVGAPACGDVMQLQIKVDDGVITDAKIKTFGCGSAIASSTLVAELLKGKTLEEAGNEITNDMIAKELSLPPVKRHCSLLAEEAVKAAIADFYKKNTEEDEENRCKVMH